MAPIRKGYVDTRWGQLHFRTCAPSIVKEPALVCLHATAYSGRTFDPLLPRLAENRRVFALDTPGYGASDAPRERPSFADYAAVIAESIAALVGEEPVDLFGYHTGALLATEMAVSDAAAHSATHSAMIRKLVLIGIPFFEGDEKAAWRTKLVHETVLREDFEQFRARWDYFVTQRTQRLSLPRAFECFVDELSVYPRDWWAHDALFDYRGEERLPLVLQPTLVINPTSALAAASSRAASLMPNARVIALPALTGAIFDLGTELVASTIDAFLHE